MEKGSDVVVLGGESLVVVVVEVCVYEVLVGWPLPITVCIQSIAVATLA